jgi:hypothetical protein
VSFVAGTPTIEIDAAGRGFVDASLLVDSPEDNCNVRSSAALPAAFTCSETGNQTVTLLVFDDFFNVAAATVNVFVQDSAPPSLDLVQPFSVSLNSSGVYAFNSTELLEEAEDNCENVSTTFTPANATCADLGDITITVTAMDAAGNSVVDTVIVTVVDDLEPTMDPIANVTFSLNNSGTLLLQPANVTFQAQDNCALVAFAIVPSLFDCNNIGSNLVNLTAEDVAGNVGSEAFWVEVSDTTPPTLVVMTATVQLNSTGAATLDENSVVQSATDNCDIASTALNQSSFTCSERGTYPVLVTITDPSGLQAFEVAQVNVVDQVPPSFDVIENVQVILNASGSAAITAAMVATNPDDNCDTPSLAVSPTVVRCNLVGNTLISITATDSCSRPKIKIMIGAIAIRGTERRSIAIGISACSIPLERLKISETRVARKIPTTKPIVASIIV